MNVKLIKVEQLPCNSASEYQRKCPKALCLGLMIETTVFPDQESFILIVIFPHQQLTSFHCT